MAFFHTLNRHFKFLRDVINYNINLTIRIVKSFSIFVVSVNDQFCRMHAMQSLVLYKTTILLLSTQWCHLNGFFTFTFSGKKIRKIREKIISIFFFMQNLLKRDTCCKIDHCRLAVYKLPNYFSVKKKIWVQLWEFWHMKLFNTFVQIIHQINKIFLIFIF